jgi:hypothetical protein
VATGTTLVFYFAAVPPAAPPQARPAGHACESASGSAATTAAPANHRLRLLILSPSWKPAGISGIYLFR